MKTPCIILWNRVFERYEVYRQGGGGTWFDTFVAAQTFLKNFGYPEVPINSRIGRQILAKIGAQKP